MKMDYPPQPILNNQEKRVDYSEIERDLGLILKKLENDMGSWDEDAFSLYIQIEEKFKYNEEIPQNIWELNQKILNKFLVIFSEDFSFPYGWNLGWPVPQNLHTNLV